jgi:hypothetical protein
MEPTTSAAAPTKKSARTVVVGTGQRFVTRRVVGAQLARRILIASVRINHPTAQCGGAADEHGVVNGCETGYDTQHANDKVGNDVGFGWARFLGDDRAAKAATREGKG